MTESFKYGERQIGTQCTLHAFNNAMQGMILTETDVKNAVKSLCLKYNTRTDARNITQKRKSLAKKHYAKALDGKFGYSPNAIVEAAKARGYYMRMLSLDRTRPFQDQADPATRYIVGGTMYYAEYGQDFGHAIAWFRGFFIDSEDPAHPTRTTSLQWTWVFAISTEDVLNCDALAAAMVINDDVEEVVNVDTGSTVVIDLTDDDVIDLTDDDVIDLMDDKPPAKKQRRPR